MIKRLIIHAGTPKTGTTSLQYTFYRHRETLIQQGLLYPSTGVDMQSLGSMPPGEPKHQWLVANISSNDQAALSRHLSNSLDEGAGGCDTMFLSTEGFFNHWWNFPRAATRAFVDLTKHLNVEIWTWFRDPVEFFASRYVQGLKNPRNDSLGYGLDWTPEDYLDSAVFPRQFDYAEFLDDAAETFGPTAVVRAFPYRGTTVSDACIALGLPPPPAEARWNATMGAVGVEMLKVLNRFSIDPHRRAAAIDVIHRLDADLGEASQPFALSPEVEARVLGRAAHSLERLRRERGLDLPTRSTQEAKPGRPPSNP